MSVPAIRTALGHVTQRGPAARWPRLRDWLARPTVHDVALVALLGLAPLLWFREGTWLVSEDLMVPPSWDEYTQFWYVWNDQLGTGAAKILDSGRFVTLFIAAALQGLGVPLVVAQAVQFVVWFTLPGLGMYYLMRGVYHGERARLAWLGAVLFYMFNLWLMSNWLGYKEPMLAATAALPFALGIWVRAFARDGGYVRAVLAAGLVSLLASPMGNNISEMLAALVPLPLLFVAEGIGALRRGQVRRCGRIALAGVALALLWGALNAFWIVPEALGIHAAAGGSDLPDFQRTSLQFLEGQSLYTPLTNVLRVLGDWTWYQGLVDPYRSFSAFFTGSPIFNGLGWLLVALVVVGAWLGRGRSRPTFVALTVLGITLSAGLNAPWGALYAWAFEHVPGFWIVRSPWFKFMLLTVIGYAVLLGLAAPWVARFLAQGLGRLTVVPLRRRASLAAASAAAVFVLIGPVYAYPVTLGLAFATTTERTFLNPNHAVPPAYTFEAAAWLNARAGFYRILTIPGEAPWLSDWGYSGFGSFVQSLTRVPVVFRRTTQSVKVSQGAQNPSGALTDQVDADLLDEGSESVAAALARMGVGYVVHERDVRDDFYKGPGFRPDDSPPEVARILQARAGITRSGSFGRWDVYAVDRPRPRFWAAAGFATVDALSARRSARLTESGWVNGLPQVEARAVPAGATRVAIATATSPDPDAQAWLFDTTDLSTGGELDPVAELSVLPGASEDWGAVEQLTPGDRWRWVKTQKGRHFVIENRTSVAQPVELRLRVLSYRRERSFYVYLNGAGEPESVTTVAADTPTDIRLPGLRLIPGENVVGFYTPFAGDERNGEQVAFAVEQSPVVGRARFVWRPTIPTAGDFELLAMAEPVAPEAWPAGVPRTLALRTGERSIALARQSNRQATYLGTVALAPGEAIELRQQGQEQYVLVARRVGTAEPPAPDVSLALESASPTNYRLRVRAAAPFVLVFNESFDAAWEARVDGTPAPHVRVDSYANGYVVNHTGEFDLAVDYWPQRAFEGAFAGSAATAALATLAAIRQLRHARRRRASHENAAYPAGRASDERVR